MPGGENASRFSGARDKTVATVLRLEYGERLTSGKLKTLSTKPAASGPTGLTQCDEANDFVIDKRPGSSKFPSQRSLITHCPFPK